mgnify:CR=1 FL=1
MQIRRRRGIVRPRLPQDPHEIALLTSFFYSLRISPLGADIVQIGIFDHPGVIAVPAIDIPQPPCVCSVGTVHKPGCNIRLSNSRRNSTRRAASGHYRAMSRKGGSPPGTHAPLPHTSSLPSPDSHARNRNGPELTTLQNSGPAKRLCRMPQPPIKATFSYTSNLMGSKLSER